jgi:imidazolonepropionase
MIPADLVVTDVAELATLATGAVPRTGAAMRQLGLVHEAAIAVRAGRVVWVGPARRRAGAVRLVSGGRAVSAGGGSVVPGFVDAHSHVLFAGDRAFELGLQATGAGYTEIARRGGGIYSTVRATRSADRPTLLAETAARLRRMAASGTTTIEVKSGYALTVPGELALLALVPELERRVGVRLVPTFLGAHAVPPEFRGRTDGWIDRLVREALPEVARRGLARFCDVFCEPGFFTVREAERLLTAARALGLGAKIHAEEFVHAGGAALAARLGAASADHLLAATSADRRRLARAKVPAVLLPLTAFGSAGRTIPGRAMVDAGVVVALGTDCSPNSWVESMPLVLAHAVHGGRLTPAEALTAVTVNAAHASGLADAGRLHPGAPADFSVFPFDSVEQLGYRYDAKPDVVYRQGKPVSPPRLREYI